MSKLFYGYRSKDHMCKAIGSEQVDRIMAEGEKTETMKVNPVSGKKYKILQFELPSCIYRIREEVKEKKGKKKDHE